MKNEWVLLFRFRLMSGKYAFAPGHVEDMLYSSKRTWERGNTTNRPTLDQHRQANHREQAKEHDRNVERDLIEIGVL